MRTRRGLCYPRLMGGGGDVCMSDEERVVVKRRRDSAGEHIACRKRNRKSPDIAGKSDLFDTLPDDLVISILCKLSSSAGCPSDFNNVLITYVALHLRLPSCFFFYSPASDRFRSFHRNFEFRSEPWSSVFWQN